MRNNLVHLIKLLDDPDQEVFFAVKKKIIAYGRETISDLELYWENNTSFRVRERIEDIIQEINLSLFKNKLGNWIKNDSQNLLYGSYLVSLFQYPELEFKQVEKSFNIVRKDLWLEMNERLTALEKVRVLNHVLFYIHKFQRGKYSPHGIQNYFINNLLESKKGNKYSLMLLYASLAQSVGLPVYGLEIPHNYLLAYYDEELAKYAYDDIFEVLFYIAPFDKGAVFGSSGLTNMFKQLNISAKNRFYHPCTNVYLIKQVFRALHSSYKKSGYTDKTNNIESIIRFIGNEIE